MGKKNMEELTNEPTPQPENSFQKPPFWQNPKIPIVAALVVLALTILAGGWLIWNERKEKPTGPPTSTYFICPDGSHHGPGVPSEGVQEWCKKHGYILPVEEVTITTDKTEYELEETVKIIVKNNSGGVVYLGSCDAYYPEIEKNGAWGRTFLKECETFSIKDEISPEESKILQECETGSKEGPLLPWKFYPGNWRITLGYYLGCVDKEPSHCLSHKTIYSNEFRIKEKESGEECYQDPREALDNFLSYLREGQYEKAAKLYHRGVDSGGYPNQRPFPSGATEEACISLEARGLAEFCYGYGTCLEHEIVGKEEVLSGDTVLFDVQFLDENGKPFEFVKPFVDKEGATSYKSVGPVFSFRVRKMKINGCYKSIDVPPMGP